jgi:hypothetical protein
MYKNFGLIKTFIGLDPRGLAIEMREERKTSEKSFFTNPGLFYSFLPNRIFREIH